MPMQNIGRKTAFIIGFANKNATKLAAQRLATSATANSPRVSAHSSALAFAAGARRGLFSCKENGPKDVSLEEAAKLIKPSTRVYLHGVACTPNHFLEELLENKDAKNVEFCHLHLEGENCCVEKAPDRFFASCFFIGKDQRKSVARGHASYIPCFLSDIGGLMRRGLVRPDVAVIQVSPPDRHGYVSLGPEVAAALPAVETAATVIALVNKNMPRTLGTGTIPLRCIDYMVTKGCDVPLAHSHPTHVGDIERRIGENIAALVPDGATLQMGIGAVPDAVLAALKNHRNLGVHTEMLGPSFLPLLRSGAVTNDLKKVHRGRSVASFALGSKELYDFLDDNPSVVFEEAAFVNNPTVIATNPNVVAVNSVVEMDITGQSCADSVGIRMLSGVGGQLDFERGAALSSGGVPILCFPSTTPSGESKIVPTIRTGGGIVTSRSHAHYVVTEHGSAFLHGLNLHQRARELIRIADPKHREWLEKEAFNRYNIKAWEK